MASRWLLDTDLEPDKRSIVICARVELLSKQLKLMDKNIVHGAMLLCHRLFVLKADEAVDNTNNDIAAACLWHAAAGRLTIDEIVNCIRKSPSMGKPLEKNTLLKCISVSRDVLLDANIEGLFNSAKTIMSLENTIAAPKWEIFTRSMLKNLIDLYKTPMCVTYQQSTLLHVAIDLGKEDAQIDNVGLKLKGLKVDETSVSSIRVRLELSRRLANNDERELERTTLSPKLPVATAPAAAYTKNKWLLENITFIQDDARRRWECCTILLRMIDWLSYKLKDRRIEFMAMVIIQRFLSLEPEQFDLEVIAGISLCLAAGEKVSVLEVGAAAALVREEKDKSKRMERNEKKLAKKISVIKPKVVSRVFDINCREVYELLSQEVASSAISVLDTVFALPYCLAFRPPIVAAYAMEQAMHDASGILEDDVVNQMLQDAGASRHEYRRFSTLYSDKQRQDLRKAIKKKAGVGGKAWLI